jgi:hypothetical protein
MTQRALKKSESLEIRIPYPTKQAFMARCQADGVSASEALRGFIERELEGPPAPRGGLRHWIAGGLIAAAVGAVALPSLAHPAQATEFHRLDLNGDGHVTLAELARADTNHDGQLSLAEYRALKR